jgi:hypothetical protein
VKIMEFLLLQFEGLTDLHSKKWARYEMFNITSDLDGFFGTAPLTHSWS